MSQLLSDAFDPEFFRSQGHRLIDRLADYLAAQQAGAGPVIRWQAPGERYAQMSEDWEQEKGSSPDSLFEEVLAYSTHTQHPRYMGHQISPPAPVGALAGLLADFLNNGMGVYEMGATGTAADRLVMDIIARALGWGPEAAGFVTAGGSLGNLTALLAARKQAAGFDVWAEGLAGGQSLAIMVSEQAHYCVQRAAQIMGLGARGVIRIPVDAQYRMRADLLPQCLEAAERAGQKVIAVAGSACTTATGTFDPLDQIADFCQQQGIWFHVDAAHGGATIFSATHRHLLRGAERADSLILDFHKMMLTPAIATGVLFRQGDISYETFEQKASYLWEKSQEREWFNLAKRTFECTKQMYALKLYAILRTHGPELIRDYVDQVYGMGKAAAALIRQRLGFELAIEPDCNIVCFRFQPDLPEEEADALNSQIRQALLRAGGFYIVQTQLEGRIWLRLSLMNPFTRLEDVSALLDEIGQIAAGLLEVRAASLR
jgi:L-2,4-diaminobutyrate decarboxylase